MSGSEDIRARRPTPKRIPTKSEIGQLRKRLQEVNNQGEEVVAKVFNIDLTASDVWEICLRAALIKMYMWSLSWRASEESVLGQGWVGVLLNPISILGYGFACIVAVYLYTKKHLESRAAFYSLSLSVPVTSIIVSILQVFTANPKKKFIDYDYVRSFPSAHCAVCVEIACCFGFMAMYLAGQIGTFVASTTKRRITSVFVILPLIILPVIVGIGTTQDNVHHAKDVAVGLNLGFSITYLCYRVYFPSVFGKYSHCCYATLLGTRISDEITTDPCDDSAAETDDNDGYLAEVEENGLNLRPKCVRFYPY